MQERAEIQLCKKILIAIDCSRVDEAILEHVSALARQNDATVCLMHVVHSHTLDQQRVLHQQAETALEAYCEKLRDEGVKAYSTAKSGEPDAEKLQQKYYRR